MQAILGWDGDMRTDRQRHVGDPQGVSLGVTGPEAGAVSRKDSPLLTQDWGEGVDPGVTSTVDEGWHVVAHSSQAESREGGDRAGAWV